VKLLVAKNDVVGRGLITRNHRRVNQRKIILLVFEFSGFSHILGHEPT
jgi:hypothetical protein